nr:hypothetical protein [Tanacetum cinerariifolium]
CALVREKLEEDLVTYFQNFQNISESSDDCTNVVNAPREPIVVKTDHGVKSSQNPPHIDKCCCECGEALDGIFCQQCICKSYGKGAHTGYNCPPEVLIISNPEPCNQTINNELPQTLPTFDSQEEKRIEEEKAASARYWKIPACCDDDDDYDYAITPEETDNSLSMRDEHLDIIPATESDEVIKSSVEDLVLIPSESEGIPDTMCDVHLVNNSTPLEAKNHFETVINSKDDISSSDDDSLYENIKYVEASPHDSKVVSLEIILLNPSKFLTKSSSTSLNSLLEETNTFHNSLPKFENFCFDLEEISSGSTTARSDISLSEYDSFIFDLTHEEFADELAHIISSPEYDCFYFWNLPDPSELMSVLNSGIRENLSSTTRVNLLVE